MNKPMNKIEQLIEELCPQGVEFRALWMVTIWDKRFNSVDRSKQSKVINYPYLLASELFALGQEKGDVFLLSTGDRTGWTTEKLAGDYICKGEVVTIPWGKSRAVQDVLKYYKGKFVTADNRIATSNNTEVLLNKFLYYWMMIQGRVIDGFYRGSGIKHPNMKKVLEMEIPIPPLTIQKEIVKILDNFTRLEAELEAELEARKKQYEHYREELLSFGDDVEWKALGEVAEIGTGSHDTKDAVESGDYIFYARGRAPLRLNVFDFDETAIITAGDGVGVGKVFHYAQGKYALHQRAYRIVPNEVMESRFIYHYIVANFYSYIKKVSVHASVTSLRKPMFLNFPIPIPPLSKQKEIVAILDKFDALVNDISTGLPAEIAARKKQYEYYRNQLLTFKPLEMQDAN